MNYLGKVSIILGQISRKVQREFAAELIGQLVIMSVMKWGHLAVTYDFPSISDHAPILLNMAVTQPSTKPPFRFFSV